MTHDKELFAATAFAFVIFSAIALFFGKFIQAAQRNRRIKPPHPTLILVFRMWFALLAAGALYLIALGKQGLFPH